MNPTEVTRYALLGGLMIVGYLLVLAWNEDYGSATRSVDAVTAAADPMVDVPADIPSAPALDADSDVPEMSVDAGLAREAPRRRGGRGFATLSALPSVTGGAVQFTEGVALGGVDAPAATTERGSL